jgi:acyl-CoA reductase-like NAD-dependent aldehyde dehydrogenase
MTEQIVTPNHATTRPLPTHVEHLIDGRWQSSSVVSQSFSPATGEPLGTYADGGADEARAAIEAARRAFRTTSWSRDRQLRSRALLQMADLLERRRDRFVQGLAQENGKPLAEAGFEIDLTIPKLRYAAALALTDSGRSAEVSPGLYGQTLRQPAGVAGVIVPWNSPVVLLVRSLAPALAAGCTSAVKMPGRTALVNGMFAQLLADADALPAGVVNIFTESGNEGAPLLISSPDVDVISYTGSTAVGRIIMREAAGRLKPVSLELGGKTPSIVFDDADLDAVVPTLVKSITVFAGQFCMTGSRVLAQRGIADELRERLGRALEDVAVGPGDDPGSDMGPMIDAANVDRVEAIVDRALAYSTAIVRGGRPDDPELAAGAYFRPALLEVDDPSSDIVQREVFGPVATFEVFDTEQDAIRLANATDYGLAAGIWTRDVDRPMRVGRELDAGTVWTNTWAAVVDQFEEGGFKQSGVGRLNGLRSLEEFLETKTLLHAAPSAG